MIFNVRRGDERAASIILWPHYGGVVRSYYLGVAARACATTDSTDSTDSGAAAWCHTRGTHM